MTKPKATLLQFRDEILKRLNIGGVFIAVKLENGRAIATVITGPIPNVAPLQATVDTIAVELNDHFDLVD